LDFEFGKIDLRLSWNKVAEGVNDCPLRLDPMPKALLIHATDKSLLLAEQPFFPFPVLGVITVASLFPEEWEVVVIDEAIEAVDLNAEVDLVGISTLTLDACHAYQLADHFRARGKPVLMGGMHPTARPEEALHHADAIVIGEAERVFPHILRDYGRGRMKGVYKSDQLPELNQLLRPRFDLLRPKHRRILHSVQATRGCPQDCEFCSVTPFFGHRYRLRPVKEVIADLEASFEGARSRTVFFVDDNIAGRLDYAKELFKALIPLKIRWGSFASVTMTQDQELMRLASNSGCIELFIGFESLSQINLDASHKSWIRADRMKDYVKGFHDHGIIVESAFVFGHDGDHKDIFRRTVDFIQATGIQVPVFGILTPYPATRLRSRLEKEGRLLPGADDWRLYDGSHVLFRPVHMTPGELEEGFLWAKKFCAAPRKIVSRMFRAPRANWLIALGLNFSMRPGRMRQIKERWPHQKGRLVRPGTW
jgi:radical SAM superfamily enzyme YgiQ (UPF0313 family)